MLDTLTKIPSIHQFNVDLKEFKQPKLFLIDIKNFKEINIAYSDNFGDFILQSFAKALKSFATLHEMRFYRIEGDTFAILKNVPFELSLLENLINHLCKFIETQKYTLRGVEFDVDAHIGISLDHFKPLQKATSALELAKKQNQLFVTYSEFATNLLKESDENIFKSIKKAIEEKKILPFFQPVHDSNKETIFKEALIRIEGKESIQTPKFFLEIAHQKGIYSTIIKEISNSIKNIEEKISINLSYHDFKDENLFEFLVTTYKNTNTIFELQNDRYLHQIENLKKLEVIKKNSIEICIDNVRSLEDLTPFKAKHIDYIKVHGDIIRLLPLEEKEYQECSKLLQRAIELEAVSIASHINSQTSLDASLKIGFKYFQGFFFSTPTSEL